MIKTIPFRMADAPRFAHRDDNPNLRRLIVRFEYREYSGDQSAPSDTTKPNEYVLAGTFYREPTQLDIEAAIAAARNVYPKEHIGGRWLYAGHEIVRGDELCSFEREQVALARRFPEAFNDNELVEGVGGDHLLAGPHAPPRWAPASYARQLLAARREGLQANDQASAA